VSDPYSGREQTRAKHFVLKHYLEALAFKVLTFSDLTYIDGFSGPWQTKAQDFGDSSFMIAMAVLRDAQQQVFERRGTRRRIRCFFSESDSAAYAELARAVAPFHRPDENFEIMTYEGRFEDAIPKIQSFIGDSFALIFIDPTGWTGYPLDKIKLLFQRRKCEVLVNFMYEFINRFSHCRDEEIIASLDPILGGPGWETRLDSTLSRGLAVEKLFRETLKRIGEFDFVVSTRIDKATAERPHFFITYGTKSIEGLKTFREIEYAALRAHARSRAQASARKREEQTNVGDMFADHEGEVREATVEEIVEEQKKLASIELIAYLSKHGPAAFNEVITHLLQPCMLRETNIKDVCVVLAKSGQIENTWGGGGRKPKENDIIKVKSNPAPI
jgi:three-Cys-motif partner protein